MDFNEIAIKLQQLAALSATRDEDNKTMKIIAEVETGIDCLVKQYPLSKNKSIVECFERVLNKLDRFDKK
jgi:hypothetical protein